MPGDVHGEGRAVDLVVDAMNEDVRGARAAVAGAVEQGEAGEAGEDAKRARIQRDWYVVRWRGIPRIVPFRDVPRKS